MKPYLLSLAAGMLVGGIYALLGVKSPAPPTIALLGLLGMLLGEQAVPVAGKWLRREPVLAFLQTHAARRVLGDHIHIPHDEA
jgi:XapX domain-containing protein